MIKSIVEEAQKNRHKNFLSLQYFACHGVTISNHQCILSNKIDPETKNYQIIDVEQLIRDHVENNSNLYFLALFACCRNNSEIQNFSGGDDKIEEPKISNFSFLFGSRPGNGVRGETQFAKNFIELCMNFYDNELGFIDLPNIFSKILSNDAQFESVESKLS